MKANSDPQSLLHLPQVVTTAPLWPHEFSSVQLLSRDPWTAACQASLFITNSRSLLKLISIELVMPSNHLILCGPLLLPPSIFPSTRLFSNESALRIKWPKYWSFSFNISPSNDWWMTSNDYSWNQLYVNLKNVFLRTCLNKVQCCIPLYEISGFVWMWQRFILFTVRSTSHQEPLSLSWHAPRPREAPSVRLCVGHLDCPRTTSGPPPASVS